MDSNYYIEYYTLERNHWWFKARLDILRSHISSLQIPTDAKVLNVGIATGATSIMLEQFGAVKSVEYDKPCFDFVKEKLPQLDLDLGSILELPYPDNSYDLVCAFDVIEHVDDDVKAVSEMIRVCKPAGCVVVTVPAFQFLWSRHDVVNHHFRRYTKLKLNKLFSGQVKIIFSSYFNFFLFSPIAGFRLISKLLPKKFMRKKKEAGSDFSVYQPAFTQNIFYRLMRSENFLLKNKISLPFGVSILISARKEK